MARVRVESHAGHRGEQEPRIVWLEDERHEVVGVGDRWLDPRADYFRVRTRDGLLLWLRRDRDENAWYLVKQQATDG